MALLRGIQNPVLCEISTARWVLSPDPNVPLDDLVANDRAIASGINKVLGRSRLTSDCRTLKRP